MKLKAVSGIIVLLLVIGTLGMVNVASAWSPYPSPNRVYLDPPEKRYYTGWLDGDQKLGENFTISVTVENVSSTGKLAGIGFKVWYNTTLLDYVSSSTPITWSIQWDKSNDTEGKVWLNGVLSPYIGGNITVFDITFNVTYVPPYCETLTPPENCTVSCPLKLNETELVDKDANIYEMIHMGGSVDTFGEESGYYEYARDCKSGAIDWWPMFRHDLSHTGYSTSTAPNTNNTIWSYTTGSFVYSSPAVADGKVYVGSHDNKTYCLDASNGALIWSYTTGHDVHSSPAVADGKVYVGSLDNKTYCLNASAASMTPNEREIWNYTTGGPVYSSPAVADGKVYVGSGDNKVYCLNASNGALIWNYTTGDGVPSSPAVADGRVYVGSADDKVYCLNASVASMTPNEREIWNYTTGGNVWPSPAVADGKVYVGSYDNKTYCLDALTGVHIWNYTTGHDVHSSPAVADGKVYVGSLDNKTYCLNASAASMTPNEREIWNYTTGGNVHSSPAVADGKVYVGSVGGKVYCLNASDGTPIWTYTTAPYPVWSSPAVADGKVYVGSNDGKVYAFGDVCGVNITSVVPWFKGEVVNETFPTWETFKVNATVQNNGTITTNCTVTAYYNESSWHQIGNQTVTNLAPGNSETVTFTWNLSGLASCNNYTLKVNASCACDASDEFVYGNVWMRVIGDVNGIGGASVADMVEVDIALGTQPGHPDYNLYADVNGDCNISVADMVQIDIHLGEEC